MKRVIAVFLLIAFILVITNTSVVYAKGRCDGCFLNKVKTAFKKVGAYFNNKIKDGYVATKKALTCKKDKVWVKGHCRIDKKEEKFG